MICKWPRLATAGLSGLVGASAYLARRRPMLLRFAEVQRQLTARAHSFERLCAMAWNCSTSTTTWRLAQVDMSTAYCTASTRSDYAVYRSLVLRWLSMKQSGEPVPSAVELSWSNVCRICKWQRGERLERLAARFSRRIWVNARRLGSRRSAAGPAN